MLIMFMSLYPKCMGPQAQVSCWSRGWVLLLHMGWRHGLVEATSSRLRRGIGLKEGYLNAA